MTMGCEMMSYSHERLSVAQTFYQLDFYLEAVGLPFRVKDLYRQAYKEKRGEHYQEAWLDHLAEDARVRASLDEPFTTHTIVEGLLRTGHEPVLRRLVESIRENSVGFTQAYIVGARRRRK